MEPDWVVDVGPRISLVTGSGGLSLSLFTAMVYLNDDFEGCTTDFQFGPTITGWASGNVDDLDLAEAIPADHAA